jgi:DNA-binding CsgD family transcriptional regulator
VSWEGLSPELREVILEVCRQKQIDVLKLKAAGMSTRGIARILGVSPPTIRDSLEGSCRKIRARTDALGLLDE